MGIFTRKHKNDAASVDQRSDTAYTRRRSSAGRDEVARELRRRARRRLLGAIAMVLVAVIVLPMVLDSEPVPLPDDVAISIPSQRTPFEPRFSAGISAPEQAGSPAEGEPDDAAAASPSADPSAGGADPRVPASIASITPVESGSAATPPAQASSQATERPQSAAQASRSNEEAQASASTRSPAPRAPQPNAAAQQKEAEAARALALLQGKPVPPPPAASSRSSSSRYAVQVVAVRSREGADDLLVKLRNAGLTAYIETIKTPDGQVHRVRLGPFETRAQAESAQARLKSMPGGYNGNLVPL